MQAVPPRVGPQARGHLWSPLETRYGRDGGLRSRAGRSECGALTSRTIKLPGERYSAANALRNACSNAAVTCS